MNFVLMKISLCLYTIESNGKPSETKSTELNYLHIFGTLACKVSICQKCPIYSSLSQQQKAMDPPRFNWGSTTTFVDDCRLIDRRYENKILTLEASLQIWNHRTQHSLLIIVVNKNLLILMRTYSAVIAFNLSAIQPLPMSTAWLPSTIFPD